jgi:hypothetical protein
MVEDYWAALSICEEDQVLLVLKTEETWEGEAIVFGGRDPRSRKVQEGTCVLVFRLIVQLGHLWERQCVVGVGGGADAAVEVAVGVQHVEVLVEVEAEEGVI